MCDYSLHHVGIGRRDRGQAGRYEIQPFDYPWVCGGREPKVAVCLLPGTEIVFDENVECEPSFGVLPNKKIGHRLARFRQVNLDNPVAHHDALEFPDGQVVLVTRLCAGQRATVLQLPAGSRAATMESAVVEPELREISLSL